MNVLLTEQEICRLLAEHWLPAPRRDGLELCLPAPRDPDGSGLWLLAEPVETDHHSGSHEPVWVVPVEYWRQAQWHLGENLVRVAGG